MFPSLRLGAAVVLEGDVSSRAAGRNSSYDVHLRSAATGVPVLTVSARNAPDRSGAVSLPLHTSSGCESNIASPGRFRGAHSAQQHQQQQHQAGSPPAETVRDVFDALAKPIVAAVVLGEEPIGSIVVDSAGAPRNRVAIGIIEHVLGYVARSTESVERAHASLVELDSRGELVDVLDPASPHVPRIDENFDAQSVHVANATLLDVMPRHNRARVARSLVPGRHCVCTVIVRRRDGSLGSITIAALHAQGDSARGRPMLTDGGNSNSAVSVANAGVSAFRAVLHAVAEGLASDPIPPTLPFSKSKLTFLLKGVLCQTHPCCWIVALSPWYEIADDKEPFADAATVVRSARAMAALTDLSTRTSVSPARLGVSPPSTARQQRFQQQQQQQQQPFTVDAIRQDASAFVESKKAAAVAAAVASERPAAASSSSATSSSIVSGTKRFADGFAAAGAENRAPPQQLRGAGHPAVGAAVAGSVVFSSQQQHQQFGGGGEEFADALSPQSESHTMRPPPSAAAAPEPKTPPHQQSLNTSRNAVVPVGGAAGAVAAGGLASLTSSPIPKESSLVPQPTQLSHPAQAVAAWRSGVVEPPFRVAAAAAAPTTTTAAAASMPVSAESASGMAQQLQQQLRQAEQEQQQLKLRNLALVTQLADVEARATRCENILAALQKHGKFAVTPPAAAEMKLSSIGQPPLPSSSNDASRRLSLTGQQQQQQQQFGLVTTVSQSSITSTPAAVNLSPIVLQQQQQQQLVVPPYQQPQRQPQQQHQQLLHQSYHEEDELIQQSRRRAGSQQRHLMSPAIELPAVAPHMTVNRSPSRSPPSQALHHSGGGGSGDIAVTPGVWNRSATVSRQPSLQPQPVQQYSAPPLQQQQVRLAAASSEVLVVGYNFDLSADEEEMVRREMERRGVATTTMGRN